MSTSNLDQLLLFVFFNKTSIDVYIASIFENVPGEIEAAYRILLENLSGKILVT